MPTATNKQVISAMYSAVFNRAPDAAGLSFWEVQFAANANSVATLAAGFANHPVFTETYGAMNDLTFVQSIYQNVLGAAGDDAGVLYWNNLLTNGLSRSDMLASFVSGALTIDLVAMKAAGQLTDAEFTVATARQDQLTNKANVGLQFTALLGAKSNLDPATDTTTIAGLNADPAYLASQAAIRSVTNDPATALAAITFLNTAAADADPIAFVNANAAPAAGAAGETFTLTTGVDNIVGTAGNDTITGALNGTADTFSAGDSIDGGAGTDNLKIVDVDGGVNTAIAASITNVENVEILDALVTPAAVAHNLAGVTGLTSFTLTNENNAANTTTVSGLASTVGVTLNKHADGTVALTYSDAAVAGDQAATITYIGGTGAVGTDMTAAGIETVSLVASGSSSTVGTITLDAAKTVSIAADEVITIADLTLANAATTTLTITGDSTVTATAVTNDAALTAINVSGTGKYVQSDALGGTAALAVTATGAAALDVITGTATHTITGGTSADRISIGATVMTTGALNGGDGTDILAISASTATVFTTAAKAKITNFETLEVGGAGTYDFEALAGLTGLVVAAGTTATITNISSTAAANVLVTGDQSTSLTMGVKDATNPGTADTLKLTLDNVTADTEVAVTSFLSTGLETLQLHSTGTTTNTNTFELAAANDRLSTVTITGDAKTTITDAASVGVEMSVNASALTNTFIATLDQNTAGQTIVGSATAANTITGGLGIDIITGGSAVDSITGGTGSDTMTGGAGADTFIFGTTGSVIGTDSDSIADFGIASDILSFSAVTVLAVEANGTTATSDVDTTVGGKISFAAADDTLAEMLVAILADTELDVAGSTGFFEFGADTYVYNAGTAIGGADDQIVKLTGITGLTTITDLGTSITLA